MSKQIYRIDGTAAHTLEQFAANFSEKLGIGYDWRNNLDAFDDILHGGFGTPDEGFILVWENSELARKQLGHEAAARWLEGVRQACHPSNRADVQRRLELAKAGRGQTMFDILVEIIESRPDIELRLE